MDTYYENLKILKKRRDLHVDVLKSNKNIVIQKGYDYQKVMDDVIEEFGKALIALVAADRTAAFNSDMLDLICEWPEESLALKYPGIGFIH